MFRLLTSTAMGLFVLFVVCIGGIRAQPYHNPNAQSVLAPGDCALPCFLGIRPGETTSDMAYTQLVSHRWIELANSETMSVLNAGFVSWKPSPLGAREMPQLGSGRVSVYNGEVSWLTVRTAFTLADVWLTLGPPDYTTYAFRLDYNTGDRVPLVFHATYVTADGALDVTGGVACEGFWEQEVTLAFVDDVAPSSPLAMSEIRETFCGG